MGSLFRSEEMRLCQMFLQTEAAYACVSELGELGLVQFKDLNANLNAFQRTYVNEVRRCEEMERKLRYAEKEILKEGLTIVDNHENPKAPIPKEMNDLEVVFDKMDTELRQVNVNNEALKQNFLELTELREVLQQTQFYLNLYGQEIQQRLDEDSTVQATDDSIINMRHQQTASLNFYVGTIQRERVPVFERVMKFITHSTVFMRVEEIPTPFRDPATGDLLHKCMFIVFYQGEQLKVKVKKVCEGMRGTIYPVPDNQNERNQMLAGVTTRISELDTVLSQSNEHRLRILRSAQQEIRSWTIKVEKIKAIYHTMNMFEVHQNSLHAECWFPLKAFDDIRRALNAGEKASGSSIPSVIQPVVTDEAPPTYYNCNKFVKGFQNIVDSYGVATYREVNPAPYTIITFPFLFAVMFGDAGHGLIMFLFGLALVLKEKEISASKLTNEIANTFFGGRYIIMMMGAFSIYTGLIYNDIFSKSFNIFGSKWYPVIKDSEWGSDEIQLNPVTSHMNSTSYAFGIDPIWQASTNKIIFLNSLKMKMAITLGVIQMVFGICLQVFNHIHFKNYIDIFIRFVPELLFLGCLFGYLVSQIFYKWLTFDATESYCAPALLIHYINMFMFKYTYPSKGDTCNPNYVYYNGQKTVQMAMFALAILSVPVLLFVKPIYLIFIKKRLTRRHIDHESLIHNEVEPAKDENGSSSEIQGNHTGGASSHGEHGTGEIIIHQVIHTIEFCLGCISHTASYLRLWALSLAHAQLSEVLWTMVLRLGLTLLGNYGGSVVVFAIFFIWANLTVAILLLMEGLSAFLHTLRLHWVEFQSKFYVGEGYHFQPFSFNHILNMQSLEEITN
ncbi:V-type proton ATPase 116 kDa subunit a 1-like isoform X3 [Physella acuta]|uniref:V-type proton ATPase 116 kDa subunit a 1-like isoform X2 n=1 Tax=Physella acuta TaxID=109671 RepID=UPI0027DB6D85|nr:V-type proton ATPase 116 kDa subunit a 1-like isoform X2 [Physella acuta]XP_059177290.1 V-type proton ATPase 116 kDa subunit a 1-like isoform X2 [Physella acuta]XP_059177291.1 V-type proton ATPase 116 kDa subunit a 1-like isoform X3 [Physella acuta]